MNSHFLLFGAIVVVGAVIMFCSWYFSKEQRLKRAMAAAPRAELRDVPEGAVAKVNGTLQYLSGPLSSPLTGRPCAYYDVIVEEYRKSGKSGSWRQIIREIEGTDFLLQKDGCEARIDTSMADFVIVRDAHLSSGTFNDATEVLEAFLARHGHESTGFLGFNKKMRYREGILSAGESVAVFGQVAREPVTAGSQAGFRVAPTRIVIGPPTHDPNARVIISDSPDTF